MSMGRDAFMGRKKLAIEEQIGNCTEVSSYITRSKDAGVRLPESGGGIEYEEALKEFLSGIHGIRVQSESEIAPYVVQEDETGDSFVSWDPKDGTLTVCEGDQRTVFLVPPDDVEILESRIQDVAEWRSLNNLSSEELAARGLKRVWCEMCNMSNFDPIPTEEEVLALYREQFLAIYGDRQRAVDEGFNLFHCRQGLSNGETGVGHWTQTFEVIEALEQKGILITLSHHVEQDPIGSIINVSRYASSEGIITYKAGGQSSHEWSINAPKGEIAGLLWSANSRFDDSYKGSIEEMDTRYGLHWVEIGGILHQITVGEDEDFLKKTQEWIIEENISHYGVPVYAEQSNVLNEPNTIRLYTKQGRLTYVGVGV
jgi:hypothetical protein